MDSCPFCDSGADRIWIANGHAIGFPDAYPVTEGHTLVARRKHVSTIYELALLEKRSVWNLVAEVRQRLLHDLQPDGFNIGFNIGFNDGLAAGQTVAHAHVHIIPPERGRIRSAWRYPLDRRG